MTWVIIELQIIVEVQKGIIFAVKLNDEKQLLGEDEYGKLLYDLFQVCYVCSCISQEMIDIE